MQFESTYPSHCPTARPSVHFADDVTSPESRVYSRGGTPLDLHLISKNSPRHHHALYQDQTRPAVEAHETHRINENTANSRVKPHLILAEAHPYPSAVKPSARNPAAKLSRAEGAAMNIDSCSAIPQQKLPLASEAGKQPSVSARDGRGLAHRNTHEKSMPECSCPLPSSKVAASSAKFASPTVYNPDSHLRSRSKHANNLPVPYSVVDKSLPRTPLAYQTTVCTLPRNSVTKLSHQGTHDYTLSRRSSLSKSQSGSQQKLSRATSISEISGTINPSFLAHTSSVADLGKAHTVVALDTATSTFINYLQPNT